MSCSRVVKNLMIFSKNKLKKKDTERNGLKNILKKN